MITGFIHFFRPNIQGLFKAFQGLQEGQNQANIMPHQMLKVESASIFVLDLRSFVG